MHIVHILHFQKANDFSFGSFFLYCLYCLVPHPRAQLLTYHHLQPSAPSLVLSQAALGKSADSLCISKGNRSGLPHGNKWKPSQYGGNWNDIQDLRLFTALVDDGRLTLLHPFCKEKEMIMQNRQNVQNMQNMT
jgi:hypothetical protein